jgi:hypothetical protein
VHVSKCTIERAIAALSIASLLVGCKSATNTQYHAAATKIKPTILALQEFKKDLDPDVTKLPTDLTASLVLADKTIEECGRARKIAQKLDDAVPGYPDPKAGMAVRSFLATARTSLGRDPVEDCGHGGSTRDVCYADCRIDWAAFADNVEMLRREAFVDRSDLSVEDLPTLKAKAWAPGDDTADGG